MRVKTGTTRRRRHKKILKQAKGYYGQRSRSIKKAKEGYLKALQLSYAHRRKKKGDFRRLWILRINAKVRDGGLSYSKFMYGLRRAGVNINRKMLANMAIEDKDSFARLIRIAEDALKG